MHHFSPEVDRFAAEVFAFALRRASEDLGHIELGHPLSPAELDAAAGATVTQAGLGAREALRLFTDVLEPACLSTDSQHYLAFVPAAPTEVSILADLAVSACSIYGGSWQEGSGAVWAENQALRWLADLAGLPPEAGGCFVAGGTIGNLSALVAARASAGAPPSGRRRALVVGGASHSSLATAAEVMDVDLLVAPGDRLTGAGLERVLAEEGERVFAVVATAGTTNLGLIDELRSVAEVCQRFAVWLHVDGAYGGAALAAPSVRRRFDGIEQADSFIVDPHKWLFAPFDSCALLYRDPERGRSAHSQHASYLDVLTEGADWNPSDFAIHLTRRARGLPFWFSLAAHGTAAYSEAVETCLRTVAEGAELVRGADHLELVCEPELSVLAFRRVGWSAAAYRTWSDELLRRGTAFVVPSAHASEPILRCCVVNPRTTADDLQVVFDSLA